MLGCRKPFLVESAQDMANKNYFTTGQFIPESGIYATHHLHHRLPREVTLLKGQQFPRCGRCGNRVLFELVRTAPDIFTDPDFRINLSELPELRSNEINEIDEEAGPVHCRKVV